MKTVQGDVPLYAHGSQVAYVFVNWMGAKLNLRTVLGNDCTSFVTLAMCLMIQEIVCKSPLNLVGIIENGLELKI